MTTAKDFAELAESKCGMNGKKFQSNFNLSSNSPWSASFVSCCAKEAGITDKVPVTSKCQSLADLAVSEGKSKWISGPAEGVQTAPSEGDIAFVVWSSDSRDRADAVGIVKGYDPESDSIDIVFGDYGTCGSDKSSVRIVTYSRSFTCIKGYVRPQWDEA